MRSSPARQVSGSARWRVFAIAWVLLSLITTVWAIAMPLTAGPDEPEHFVKAAAVARGELLGTAGPEGTIVDVPKYVAWAHEQSCTAYVPTQAADCILEAPGDPWRTVEGTTTAGLYNPVYYALVGWPTLIFHDQTGLYAMRIVSGVLGSAFLALCVMLIASWARRIIPLLGLLVAITPMVFFVNGLVNPSSLEIAATLAAFVAMLSVVLFPDGRLLRERATILAVASALAVNTRAISPLWVAVALLAPLVLLGRAGVVALFRRRPVWIAAIVVVATTIAALAWAALTSSVSFGSGTNGQPQYDNVGATPLFGFVKMLMLTFTFGHEMIGDLGWFDTELPLGAYYVWAALVGCLVVLATITLRGRKAIFAIVLLAALLLGPATAQAVFINSGGFIWQGRYTLPIFVCFIVGLAALLALRLGSLESVLMRRLTVLVTFVWMLAQVLSFLQALRRYAVGAGGSFLRIFREPDWAPPLGTIATMSLLAVFVLAFAGFIVWLARDARGADAVGSAANPEGSVSEGYSPTARG
jgi:hypothetical protein